MKKQKYINYKAPVIFTCLPRNFRISLKYKVCPQTMVTCYVFDFIIFLMMVINLTFGPQGHIFEIEIGILTSALYFGVLYDVMGRKQLFMMRLFISSLATMLVPFITFLPIISFALVMCSVSLTVPFITDLVQYNKRGLAYSYLGCLFTVAIAMSYILIEFGIPEYINTDWIFIISGVIGLTIDIIMCWGFSDIYKKALVKKKLNLVKKIKRVFIGLKKSYVEIEGSIIILFSFFVNSYCVITFFYVKSKYEQDFNRSSKVATDLLVCMLMPPVLIYCGN